MSNLGTRSKIIVAPEVIECFNQYNWPGNVRELQNVIEKMLLYCDAGVLGLERLPAGIPWQPAVKACDPDMAKTQPDFLHLTRMSKKDKIYEDERQTLLSLLSWSGGNISSIAKELGINRCTVYRKMKRYNIICETR